MEDLHSDFHYNFLMSIYTGTCSWTERTLVQSDFYPKGARTSEGRLQFYAEHFKTVEVDATYYAIPDKKNALAWAQRTPDDFIFHIKAYGALTQHGINPLTLPRDIRDMLTKEDLKKQIVYIKEASLLRIIAQSFREALSPLMMRGKLGVFVFQFPPWFYYSNENIDYIFKCKEMFLGLRMAVEFRHGSWLVSSNQDKVLHFLRKNQITYVMVDEPQYGDLSTVPFVPALTSDIAYFRLHGRNKENWLKKNIETALRFDYDYSERELEEFASPIKSIAKKAKNTYVMFNNHGSPGIRNALTMKKLLDDSV